MHRLSCSRCFGGMLLCWHLFPKFLESQTPCGCGKLEVSFVCCGVLSNCSNLGDLPVGHFIVGQFVTECCNPIISMSKRMQMETRSTDLEDFVSSSVFGWDWKNMLLVVFVDSVSVHVVFWTIGCFTQVDLCVSFQKAKTRFTTQTWTNSDCRIKRHSVALDAFNALEDDLTWSYCCYVAVFCVHVFEKAPDKLWICSFWCLFFVQFPCWALACHSVCHWDMNMEGSLVTWQSHGHDMWTATHISEKACVWCHHLFLKKMVDTTIIPQQSQQLRVCGIHWGNKPCCCCFLKHSQCTDWNQVLCCGPRQSCSVFNPIISFKIGAWTCFKTMFNCLTMCKIKAVPLKLWTDGHAQACNEMLLLPSCTNNGTDCLISVSFALKKKNAKDARINHLPLSTERQSVVRPFLSG